MHVFSNKGFPGSKVKCFQFDLLIFNLKCERFTLQFVATEKDGLKLTTGMQKTYVSSNKHNRKTKKTFDYEGEDTGYTRALEDARQSFCIGTYFPIIDLLTVEV